MKKKIQKKKTFLLIFKYVYENKNIGEKSHVFFFKSFILTYLNIYMSHFKIKILIKFNHHKTVFSAIFCHKITRVE